jgi:hypothetical protein
MGTLGNLSAENEGKGAAMTGYMAKHDDVCRCDDCCAQVYRQGVQNATRAPAETPRAPRDPDGTLWERARDLSYSLMLSGGLYGAPATIEANVARAIFDALAEGRAYSPATAAVAKADYEAGRLAWKIADAVLRSPLFTDEGFAIPKTWAAMSDDAKARRLVELVQTVNAALHASERPAPPAVDMTDATPEQNAETLRGLGPGGVVGTFGRDAPAPVGIGGVGSDSATLADAALAGALSEAFTGAVLRNAPDEEQQRYADAMAQTRARLLLHADARRGK